jgi:UDP-glucose 4-epimerase
MSKHFIVTGCAGFIGSSMVDKLLGLGNKVTGIDNLSTGQKRFLLGAYENPNFKFIQLDITNPDELVNAFSGGDVICHFAANADVRFGVNHTRRDLEQNTIATFNVLEAMRKNKIQEILFSSTGSVYGEAVEIPTTESCPFPVQTSLYGASKLAGESLISAYAEAFGFKSWIFRFVSILGERYTHGHVFDFYRQLKSEKTKLHVLGDGKQRKSYLYVQDCLSAILTAYQKSSDPVNIFNLGTDEFCEVNDSIKWICSELNLSPNLTYSGGDRGWVGDNPFIFLDTSKIRSLGWKPELSIEEAVLTTVKYLQENEWVFEECLD